MNVKNVMNVTKNTNDHQVIASNYEYGPKTNIYLITIVCETKIVIDLLTNIYKALSTCTKNQNHTLYSQISPKI